MTRESRELTCRELADFLADYLEGRVDEETRSLFEEHLAECPDCVAYVRTYAETMRLTKEAYANDAAVAAAPDALVRAILAARARER